MIASRSQLVKKPTSELRNVHVKQKQEQTKSLLLGIGVIANKLINATYICVRVPRANIGMGYIP